MSTHYILNEAGEPEATDLLTWGQWFQDNHDARRIGDTAVGDVRVSTVFLGLNHVFSPTELPLLYETMIFGGEHDQWTDRYSTRLEAVAGHERAVRIAKEELPDA